MRLMDRALDLYGIREVPGVENNPIIMKFFETMGKTWVQGDETAWCSAFINYLAIREGFEYSGELHARSWLGYGQELKYPSRGCLTVLWRESPQSWKGHVGIFIREDEDSVWLLGGNQSNEVNISPYPKYRVLSHRILKQR